MEKVYVKFYQDDGTPAYDIFVFRSKTAAPPGTGVLVQAQKTIKFAVVCEPPVDHPVLKLEPNKRVLAIVTDWMDDAEFLSGMLKTEVAKELDKVVKRLSKGDLYELAAQRDPATRKLLNQYLGRPEKPSPETEPVKIYIPLSKEQAQALNSDLYEYMMMPWGSTLAMRVLALCERLRGFEGGAFVMDLAVAEDLLIWTQEMQDWADDLRTTRAYRDQLECLLRSEIARARTGKLVAQIKIERQPIPITPCDLSRLSSGKPVRELRDGDAECVRPEDDDGLPPSEMIGGEH